MARNDTWIDATPEQVFEVLADPFRYADWVVGAKTIRGADAGFPKKGTKFHHTVGVGPVTLSDHSEVVDVNPPWRLELRAKTRPFGTALVTLILEPRDGGTHVSFYEDGGDPLTKLAVNGLAQIAMTGRNVEALRRLKRICEEHAAGRAA